MELQTVDIKVGKILREYVLSSNGSDTLTPEKDSLLWGCIKQYLCCYSELEAANGKGYIPVRAEECAEYIKISLRSGHDCKAYCRSTNSIISINNFYRCYMTEHAQNIIRRFLYKAFKKTFIDYMKGALGNNCDLKIKDAIEEFCRDHQLTMDNIAYESLKKAWYRYNMKLSVMNCLCTLNF